MIFDPVRRLTRAAQAVGVLAGTGLAAPTRPDRLAGMALALGRWGLTSGAAYAAAAARCPDRPALIDDREVWTFAEMDQATDAIAGGLRARGVRPQDAVAILARNAAPFVLAQAAAAKCGADLVYANTGFGGPQLGRVLHDERVRAVIADAEFDAVVAEAAPARLLVHAWRDGGRRRGGPPSLTDLVAEGEPAPPPPGRSGRQVLLTSGTTGHPKGAPRDVPGLRGMQPLLDLLGVIPLHVEETTLIASPLFHAWGFAHLSLGQLLRSTLVLARRFDPERTLALAAEHQATVLVAVPVMLQRILALPESVRRRYPLPALRAVAVSGSLLPADVAARWTDEFGPTVYNLYGSTEVAYVSVATPTDQREAPGSVGRPLAGVRVRLVDADGRDVPAGQPGRIFAGNALAFAGYSDGADKQRLDGLVATGDMGRLDGDGRLWVEGRDDDMIVSGGENVFPQEVEECLLTHPGVLEAAVVGAQDEEFGQRLVAFVVPRGEVSADELRAHVKTSLAGYKVPREFRFRDALPRNETGKVLNRVLREETADSPPAARPRSSAR